MLIDICQDQNLTLIRCSFFLSIFIKILLLSPSLFLDALASLKPILFTELVTHNFFGLQITSESISENVIGLGQYHKHQC